MHHSLQPRENTGLAEIKGSSYKITQQCSSRVKVMRDKERLSNDYRLEETNVKLQQSALWGLQRILKQNEVDSGKTGENSDEVCGFR